MCSPSTAATMAAMTVFPLTSPEKAGTGFGELLVSDAMHAGVLTCPLDAPLEAVAEMMSAYGIHCVVVFEDPDEADGGSLWGVVSDLDLIGIAASEDISQRTVGSSAASPVVMISFDDTLTRAAQLMREYGTSHLVVVDPESTTPLGVLSTLDLARVLAGRGV
jgi:CBS domain-containing protein